MMTVLENNLDKYPREHREDVLRGHLTITNPTHIYNITTVKFQPSVAKSNIGTAHITH